MKKILFLIALLTASLSGYAQPLESFLKNVEQNNPQLIAVQKWLEAEATQAKTGIYPDNPEFSYSYLMGSPEAIGDQEEIEITQSFKLPGYYTSKSAIQQLGLKQKKALAEKRRREVLHSARKHWFNLIWLNKKAALLKTRNVNAEKMVALMRKGFEGGEISKPAYDKARIYAITIQNEWRKTKADIKVTKQQLRGLNGNNPIPEIADEYPPNWELPEMDSAVNHLAATNPDLRMAQLRIQQSKKEIKHQRMSNWPTFKAGFKSETILDQKLQGFQAGISIPLWENANKVEHAKLQARQEKARLVQKENEMRTRWKVLYNEVRAARDNYQQMQTLMEDEQASSASLELLKSGQISFSEYITEVEMIYDSRFTYLAYQKDFFVGLSKLRMLSE